MAMSLIHSRRFQPPWFTYSVVTTGSGKWLYSHTRDVSFSPIWGLHERMIAQHNNLMTHLLFLLHALVTNWHLYVPVARWHLLEMPRSMARFITLPGCTAWSRMPVRFVHGQTLTQCLICGRTFNQITVWWTVLWIMILNSDEAGGMPDCLVC